jgi:hypothetical protein
MCGRSRAFRNESLQGVLFGSVQRQRVLSHAPRKYRGRPTVNCSAIVRFCMLTSSAPGPQHSLHRRAKPVELAVPPTSILTTGSLGE